MITITWLKKILLFKLCCLALMKFHRVNEMVTASYDASTTTPTNTSLVSSPIYAQMRGTCQRLGLRYEEVYDFWTRNFRVSICRQGDSFYYYRQSKSNPQQAILLRATTVFGGEVFKAVQGKITYFVGVNTDGYYSSVMQANHEIVVEPEVKSAIFDLNISMEEPLKISPTSPELTKLSEIICDTQKIPQSPEIEYDLGLIDNDQLLELIENNSDTESKDAILYSSLCK